MTTINNSDDLLELLKENEKFREDVRRMVLTDELLALPAVFADFRKSTESDLADLKGIGLETRLYDRGLTQLATLLRLHDVGRVRVAEVDDDSDTFNADLLDALNRGTIQEEHYDRVLETDMIVSAASRASSQPVYVAVEASHSVSRSDIRKVGETADTLRVLYPDAEVHRALYYMNITPFIQKEAEEQGIHLVPVSGLRWQPL